MITKYLKQKSRVFKPLLLLILLLQTAVYSQASVAAESKSVIAFHTHVNSDKTAKNLIKELTYHGTI